MGAPSGPLFAQPAQLFQRRGHELLPAEARLHTHDQNEIQLVQIRGQRLRGRARLDGQADLAPLRLDGVDGLLDIVLTFQMEILQRGPRLCKRLGISQRAADHQVHIVERRGHPLVQALQHRHTKADVGHEMAVHHIVVQHLRPGVQHHPAVCAQLREIG